MKQRTAGLALALVFCMGVLAGCTRGDSSEALQEGRPDTSDAAQPQSTGEEETGGEMGEPRTATGENGLLAIQSNETGLVQLESDPGYYVRPGDVNDEAGTVGYYELVYDDGSGPKSYGEFDHAFVTMYEYQGQLYYTDGETGVYLFDKQSGETSPWASKEGSSIGAGWYTDGIYLYTALYVQDGTGNSKECSIARIKWTDGSVEEMAGTDNFFIQGAWANTLFVSDWSLSVMTLTAFDVGSGETKLLKEMPEGFEGTLLDGVYYTAELEDGSVVLKGENLLTGETGSLALGIEAQETMVLGYSEGSVWLYVVDHGNFKDFGVNVKTGEIKEGEI